MMHGETQLRLEFIVHDSLHQSKYESRVGRKFALDLNSTVHTYDCVCLDCYTHCTTARLFHCLIITIINSEIRLRLEEFIVQNGNGLNKPNGESWVDKPRLCVFGLLHPWRIFIQFKLNQKLLIPT